MEQGRRQWLVKTAVRYLGPVPGPDLYSICFGLPLQGKATYVVTRKLNDSIRENPGPGDFTHLFWGCPIVFKYWEVAVSIVNKIDNISLAPTMSLCQLGLVKELVPMVAERTLLSLLFFYSCKATTMSWKKAAPSSLTFWKHLVNVHLPLYKEPYANRGCPKNYDKVWSKWLADPTKASLIDRS